uniref:Uncharacterized protein n=1 Tax=Arundo donax TaxID=35708 RepID=A0A0A9ACZ8_ARUDO
MWTLSATHVMIFFNLSISEMITSLIFSRRNIVTWHPQVPIPYILFLFRMQL